jgi:hypothetical protein
MLVGTPAACRSRAGDLTSGSGAVGRGPGERPLACPNARTRSSLVVATTTTGLKAAQRTHGREVSEAGDEVNVCSDVRRQGVGLGRPDEVTLACQTNGYISRAGVRPMRVVPHVPSGETKRRRDTPKAVSTLCTGMVMVITSLWRDSSARGGTRES